QHPPAAQPPPPKARKPRLPNQPEPGNEAWDRAQTQPQHPDQAPPPPAAAPEPAAPPKKKRRWFGLGSLMILMIASMALAGGAIWYFMPPRAQITGMLTFKNVNKLTELERTHLQSQQRATLADERLRV